LNVAIPTKYLVPVDSPLVHSVLEQQLHYPNGQLLLPGVGREPLQG